jgi:hypothetical protein
VNMSLKIRILTTLLAFGIAPTSNGQQLQIPQLKSISEISNNKNLRSANGQKIDVYQFSALDKSGDKTEAEFSFLIQGGIHGNEQLTPRFVRWLTKRYARGTSLLNQFPREKVAFDFVPVANPDGVKAANRYNANEVNLNRNFGILWGISQENPGKNKFSEPETKSIKYLFSKKKYTSAVDVHGYTNWIVAPTSPEKLISMGGKVDLKKAAKYKAWIDAINEEMNLLPGYTLKTAGGLGDGGAFEDWAFWSEGTFSYCLELKSKSRFATNYRREFSDIRKENSGYQIDLFKRYELFVHRMFEHAIEIKTRNPGIIADTKPIPKSKTTQGTH